jgi:hypothetical protein
VDWQVSQRDPSAPLRHRRWRRRQSEGVMTLPPCEIRREEINQLVASGLLAPDRCGDELAVLHALYTKLDAVFPHPPTTRTLSEMTKPTEESADIPAQEGVETPDLAVTDEDDTAAIAPVADPDLAHELEMDEVAQLDAMRVHPHLPLADLEHALENLYRRHDAAFRAGWFVAAGRACIKIGEVQAHMLHYWLGQPMPEIARSSAGLRRPPPSC